MNDKIELTEEQFKEIWKCCSDNYEVALFNAKSFGYIKQNPVEKAEELLEKLGHGVGGFNYNGEYVLLGKELDIIKDALKYKKQLEKIDE